MTALKLSEHIAERNLEDYCLGRVPGTDLDEFEDHVLVCSQCQDNLQETDLYIVAMRRAIVALAREEAVQGRRTRESFVTGMLRRLSLPLPMAVLAGVSALALLVGVGPLLNVQSGLPVMVALDSSRGGDAELTARAPERRPLVLSLDLTGLPSDASYQVRLVNAQGAPVLEAGGRPNQGRLIVKLRSRLPRGSYWVRLYDRGDARTSLREYGLRLQ